MSSQSSSQSAVSVLFVCLGNICRSPSAHGIFAHQVAAAGLDDRILIDSAGTGSWHIGNPPDPRTQESALRRGYDLSELRARRVERQDFERFDYIIVMDNKNLEDVRRMQPPTFEGRLDLLLTYAPSLGQTEVPDPYHGDGQGFEHVLDLVEAASAKLLEHIRERHF